MPGKFESCLLVFCIAAALCVCGAKAPRPEYRRIISIGPNVTETICALHAHGRLVGVSDFCRVPTTATLRRVGGPATPKFETISALRPDLIVMQFATPKMRSFAAERGIALAEVHMDSIATIERDIGRLGVLLGCEDAATSLTASMRRDLAGLQKQVDAIPAARRPLVFLSVDRQAGSLAGILTASDKSFLGEAHKLAGGANAFGDMKAAYPEISREALWRVAPRSSSSCAATPRAVAERGQLLKDWSRWDRCRPSRATASAVLGGEEPAGAGPRLAQTVRDLHEAL